jgi:23S rRNA (cytosine1962-C5)-methyltransferase
MFIVKAKRGKAKKIKNFYPNLFRDEIKEIIGDGDFGIANLFSAEDEFLGTGLFNRKSNKSFRLISNTAVEVNAMFFSDKISRANRKRSRFFTSDCYRVINAESDFLPGIIVDKFKDILVLQIRHIVWEKYKSFLIEGLLSEFKDCITGIYERSDFESSPEYSLKKNKGVIWGDVPNELIIDELGIKYKVSIPSGQKTGFFLDQRENRDYIKKIIHDYDLKDKKGLDLFSYTGSFSFAMASTGMHTVGVDKSDFDITTAKENASLNGLSDKCKFFSADIFELETLKKEYSLIVLDPPSLVKDKKEKHYGKRKFTELINKSLQFLQLPGILGVCSCAYHIDLNDLEESLRRACAQNDLIATTIGIGLQSPDHPWMIQIPESLYLKCLWVYIDKI